MNKKFVPIFLILLTLSAIYQIQSHSHSGRGGCCRGGRGFGAGVAAGFVGGALLNRYYGPYDPYWYPGLYYARPSRFGYFVPEYGYYPW